MYHSKKKSRDSSPLNNVDPISNLHESVLSHILSRLPIKDAAKTCILSKQWKDKWTYIYHVDLLDCSTGSDSFANFSDKLFSCAFNLKSFHLSCHGAYNFGRVVNWVFQIFKHENIESLEVSCLSYSNTQGFLLLWSLILGRPLLKNLHLSMSDCTLNISVDNSFANLKVIHLQEIHILNESPNKDTLIFNFLFLELLEIIRCRWENVKFVKIYAPLLNSFSYNTNPSYARLAEFCIEIISSRLSTFSCSGALPYNVILNGSQVLSATFYKDQDIPMHNELNLRRTIGLQVWKILNGSSRLRKLKLSNYYIRALESAPDLRPYKELIRLQLSGANHTTHLLKILQIAPSLKFLSVDVCAWDKYDYDAMKLVPPCFKSHTEEVNLVNFAGHPHQYNLAKFLLKNCVVLKKLSISPPRYPPKEYKGMFSMLSKFPNISKKLIIVAPR